MNIFILVVIIAFWYYPANLFELNPKTKTKFHKKEEGA